jgi:hypothetical protein
MMRKKGANKDKTMTLEQSQDIIDNTQFESIDKIVETRRTSARNKKTPSIRGNDFLWRIRHTAWKKYKHKKVN